MRGRSIGAIAVLGIVMLVAGGLVAIMAFAHVAGRTTVERPEGRADGARPPG